MFVVTDFGGQEHEFHSIDAAKEFINQHLVSIPFERRKEISSTHLFGKVSLVFLMYHPGNHVLYTFNDKVLSIRYKPIEVVGT